MAIRTFWVFLSVTLCFTADRAWAQGTQPAGGPSAALAEFRLAMDGINPGRVSRILIADDAGGRAKIAQLQKLANALAHLRAAVTNQFGAKTFYLQERPPADPEEKIDGDSASVTTADGKTVQLRRVNGQWRIPVRQEDRDAIQQHLAELQVMTEAIESIAADTEADRFDTADEVLRAAQEELTRGKAIHHAATRATTAP